MKHAKLDPRLQRCHDDFDALLAAVPQNHPNLPDFKKNVAEAKKYYQDNYNAAAGFFTARDLIEEYERFIKNAQMVASGERSVEVAYKDNHNSTYSRKTGVVAYNIFKMCEAIFWALTAVFSFCAALSVGIPLILIPEPFTSATGLVTTIATASLGMRALKAIDKCADEFASFDPIENEERIENVCFSFFAPAKKQDPVAPQAPLVATI